MLHSYMHPQDIAGELETVLSAAHLEAVPSDKATSNSLALQLLPSLALQQCLNRCVMIFAGSLVNAQHVAKGMC